MRNVDLGLGATAVEDGVHCVHGAKIYAVYDSAPQIGTRHSGLLQTSSHQMGLPEVSAGQVGSLQIRMI